MLYSQIGKSRKYFTNQRELSKSEDEVKVLPRVFPMTSLTVHNAVYLSHFSPSIQDQLYGPCIVPTGNTAITEHGTIRKKENRFTNRQAQRPTRQNVTNRLSFFCYNFAVMRRGQFTLRFLQKTERYPGMCYLHFSNRIHNIRCKRGRLQ